MLRFKMFLFITCFLFTATNIIAQQRPNIIFILADDMGYGDVSALNKNSKIATPAIDQLMQEGMTFTNAHSSSAVCTPSRYSILTGRYPWRSTLKSGVLGLYAPPLIGASETTVGELLKGKGYQTACIGKWHLGMNWHLQNGYYIKDSLYAGHNNEEVRIQLAKQINFNATIDDGPNARGFDYYFGTDVPNYPPYTFIENNRVVQVPDTQKPKEMYGHPGAMITGWKLENILPALAQKASGYIASAATQDRPFFLYLSLTSPHSPIAPSDKFKRTSKAGLYGDFVQETDWVVGQVMTAVKKAGIEKNTLIIFTSDNGSPETDGEDMYGKLHSIDKFNHDPSDGFKGIKADIWEGGHHIPLAVKWPAVVEKGTTSNATVCLSDFFATCAAILKTTVADSDAVDSYSLLPILKGSPSQYQRSYTVHSSFNGYFAIREGKWKLIMSAGSGGWSPPTPGAQEQGLPLIQLYDMEKDEFETSNVYASHPEVVDKLKRQLTKCIEDGRSTDGPQMKNDGKFIPATVQWMQ